MEELLMRVDFECVECGKSYVRYYKNNIESIPQNSCCSMVCKGLWQSKNLLGENNPNFNKRWDDELKEKQRERMLIAMTPERRTEIGNQHRGKTLSKETIQKIHGHRTSESYSRPHTEDSKKKIGEKSSKKFEDKEFTVKYRKTMEERGYWVPLKDRDAYEVYADASDWIANMFEDLSTDECNRINNIGMFNTKTNQKGMCRDHMHSRKDGFNQLVFPEILRHPCNCEFILHSKNSGKQSKSSKDLNQLFSDIRNYNGNWHEHQRVLDLIESYEAGFRWDLQQFIEGFYNV